MHRIMGERSLGDTRFSGPDACEMYANVVRARRFDERALARREEGWLSGYPSFRGREAAQVGAAFAATPTDVLVPTRRCDALQLARGVPPADLLSFYRGGPEHASARDASVFPRTAATGAGLPVAVGAGMARAHTDEEGAALAFLDARATGEGDFHEACNFAGVFEAPCVFFCENDGRDTARIRRTAAPTVAEKAAAYGFEGVRVDGTDVLAVADAVSSALDDARNGRPVLVEAVTGGARDDPAIVENEPTESRDPLERFETYLDAAGVVDDAFVAETREAAAAELDRAVTTAEASTGDPDGMFEYVYADVPEHLRTQRARMRTTADADTEESG